MSGQSSPNIIEIAFFVVRLAEENPHTRRHCRLKTARLPFRHNRMKYVLIVLLLMFHVK